MHRNDTIPRADRVLMTALAILLAGAGAVFGSALTYRPNVPSVAHVAAAPVPAPRRDEDMALAGLLAEHRCLSEALYYEARGEGRSGQQAVAEVVFHRLNSGNYGHSICAVVYEGSSHSGCQFSFTCGGDLLRPREAVAWQDSENLATEILTGEVRLKNATGGATNYHAVYVNPVWAAALKKTAQIGNHIFYRTGRNRES